MKKIIIISLLLASCKKESINTPIKIEPTPCHCDITEFHRIAGDTSYTFVYTPPFQMSCDSAGQFYSSDSNYIKLVDCW